MIRAEAERRLRNCVPIEAAFSLARRAGVKIEAGPGLPVLNSLAARVLAQEHVIYPRAVDWFLQGRLRLDQGRVVLTDEPMGAGALIVPAG